MCIATVAEPPAGHRISAWPGHGAGPDSTCHTAVCCHHCQTQISAGREGFLKRLIQFKD